MSRCAITSANTKPGEERPAPVEVAASTDPSEEAAAEAAHSASDASLAEEEDALRLDLTQDGEEPPSEDGSGVIDDELAEEQLAEITETGEELDTEGADSLDSGGRHSDVSEKLRCGDEGRRRYRRTGSSFAKKTTRSKRAARSHAPFTHTSAPDEQRKSCHFRR